MQFEPTISIRGATKIMEKHRDPNGDSVIDSMIDAGRVVQEAGEHIHQTVAAIMSNPLETQLKRKKQARDAAFRIFDGAAKKIDKNRAAVAATIARLKEATMPKPPKDAIEALHHGEIRAALLRMATERDRGKAVEQAIVEGDDAFVAAAVLSSSPLCGLAKEHRAVLREAWRRARHGETCARIERLEKALTSLDRCSGALQSFVFGMFDQAEAEAIKTAETKARAAQQASEAA